MDFSLAERTITIALMRAYFDEGFNNTVENVLISTFQKLEIVSNRVVPIDLISSHLFAHLESCKKTGGTFVRVLEYENGGIGVIDLDVLDSTQIVEEFVHPNKKDFLKRETVFLCVDNYILACNIGNKSGATASSILNFGVKADVVSKDLKMKILDVPDHTTIQDLVTTGVRSIDFDVTDFIQNLDALTHGTEAERLMQCILRDVSGATTHRKLSTTTGKLHLSRGRLKKINGKFNVMIG